MPINPRAGESREQFVSRCIATEIDAGKPQDQAAAICYSVWRDKKFNDSCDKVQEITKEIKGEL